MTDEPTTQAGRALLAKANIAGNLNVAKVRAGILAIETEARQDADSQIAALVAAIETVLTDSSDRNIWQTLEDAIADLDAAAKDHDAALVAPWREALGWFVKLVALDVGLSHANDRTFFDGIPLDLVQKARALLDGSDER